jgi:hypothetical protein
MLEPVVDPLAQVVEPVVGPGFPHRLHDYTVDKKSRAVGLEV